MNESRLEQFRLQRKTNSKQKGVGYAYGSDGDFDQLYLRYIILKFLSPPFGLKESIFNKWETTYETSQIEKGYKIF